MKFVKALLLTTVAALLVYAAAPSYQAVDAVYSIKRTNTVAAGSDTLAGDSDTATLFTNYSYKNGYEYILTRGAFTGTGSDSVKVAVEVVAEDEAGTQLYVTAVDSFTASAGEAILIPLNGSIIAQQIDIRLVTYTDHGGQAILPKFELYTRIPIQKMDRLY